MHTRFCAREFIKRHLIGSRPTLVSLPPPFFHPFALPPCTPRTKVEYIRDRIRVCTMSRAMSLYFSSPLYSLHTPLISSSSLHAPISIFARRSSSFSNPFFPSCALRNRDEEFNDCCSYFRRDCRTLWLMLYQYVNYTVNVKKKRGERTERREREGWVEFRSVEGCANIRLRSVRHVVERFAELFRDARGS